MNNVIVVGYPTVTDYYANSNYIVVDNPSKTSTRVCYEAYKLKQNLNKY